jgi:iron complex outermembrane receptor protein
MKTRFARSFFLSVAITSLTHPAHSADADAGDRNYAFIEEVFADSLNLPVVLTPSRMATPIHESPSAVTVIDRELIRASGAQSIVEALRLVPGLVVSYEDSWKPSIRYHGPTDNGSARHLQVLVDGRSVYQPGYAQVYWDWLGINLEDIERIEVVRGPATATHGANAMMGTIQIITRHSADTPGSQFRLSTSSHEDRYQLSHSKKFDLGSWRISVGTQEKSGFDKTYDANDRYLIDKHDGSDIQNLNFRLDLTPDIETEIQVNAGLLQGDIGQGMSGYTAVPPHELETKTRFIQADIAQFTSDSSTWRLRASHQELDQENRWVTNGVAWANEDRFERMSELEIEHERRWSANFRAISGINMRLDQVRGETWFGHNDWIKKWRQHGFVNTETRLTPTTLLHAGLALDHVEHLDETNWSHNLAVTQSLSKGQSWRLGWGRSLRYPDLFEELGDWAHRLSNGTTLYHGLATPGLKPEQTDSIEIGYIASQLFDQLNIDIKLFEEKSSNLTDTTDDQTCADGSSCKTSINQDTSRSRGYEFQLDWQTTKNTRLRGNYSRITHFSSNDTALEESTPRHVGSALAIFDLPNEYEASAAFHYLGSYDGTKNLPEHPYRRYDIRLTKNLHIGSTPLSWTILWQHQRDLTTPENGNNISDDHSRLTGILELKF